MMTPMLPKRTPVKNLRAGFTLMEAVLVVAVLAILIGMSMPAVLRFTMQRDDQTEANTLLEIKRAFQAYLADKNSLPPLATWADELAAGYTNLSRDKMLTDEWGRPRALRVFTDTTRRVQDATLPVNYVTLHSSGGNLLAEAPASGGIGLTGTAFNTTSNAGWWNDPTPGTLAVINLFGSLAPGGDDQLMKFTDYTEKLGRYNLTIQRIDRISNALEALARTRYTSWVADCAARPRNASGLTGLARCDNPGELEAANYFPRAKAIEDAEAGAVTLWNYFDAAIVVNNSAGVARRRTQMVQLMRVLGLPDEFCCSALEVDAADGQPLPFFYFSNPRPRAAISGCSTRPTGVQPKLSPRIVTKHNTSSTSNPTCG
jgi:type II secretory pathway pseudopilin PulG